MPNDRTRDISPKMDLPSAEQELLVPAGTELMGQNIGGLSFFSDVFKRGYGDDVFGTDSSGSWWGGADYANAVSKIDYAGNAFFTSVTIDGYLADGEAGADVNANATKIEGAKIVDVSITTTQIADNAISTPKLIANAVTADKIIANAITAGKIATNAVEADKIQANAVTASKISVSSLSAISADVGTITAGSITGVDVTSSTGTEKIVLDSGNYIRFYAGGNLKASIRGTTRGAGGISNDGDFFVANNRSYHIASSTGGSAEYGGISVTSANQFWLTLGTANTFFLYNNAQDSAYFTASNSTIYSGRSHQVNGSLTCESIYLNYGAQNEGNINAVNNIYGYNDLQLYGNGTIRFYPGSNKVWFDKNIDLNDKDLDAGQTLWAYSFSNRSDRRLKKNIDSVGSSLSDILKLNPVSFNWKKNDKKSYGLIAQDVYRHIPDVVRKADDGYLSIDYISLIPFVIKAIQELYSMQTGEEVVIEKPKVDDLDFFIRSAKEIKIGIERETDKYGSKKNDKIVKG